MSPGQGYTRIPWRWPSQGLHGDLSDSTVKLARLVTSYVRLSLAINVMIHSQSNSIHGLELGDKEVLFHDPCIEQQYRT
jgi:hypothetical protein